ncbi:hypothetical protein [Photobacterium leiognathi]|uniref:hypothetical protein n=1 Tax=Photobacterium leiognathi TaxID=553611 RepID=UPI00273879A9|nr:hypothetical protein [Photobacterium leiognathi]
MTESLISPISAQIDPIKLGEQKRALEIATEYARRLNELSDNLISSEALEELIAGYPSHSFVIDRKEAKRLFKNVRKTETEEEEFIYRFSRLYLEKIDYYKLCFDGEAKVEDFQEIISQFNAVDIDKNE